MAEAAAPIHAANRIADHFKGVELPSIATVEKIFPSTVRPDLEAAIGGALQSADGAAEFFGLYSREAQYQALTFAGILAESREPAVIAPAQYMDIDIGGGARARCVTTGIWLFAIGGGPGALLVSRNPRHEGGGMRVEAVFVESSGGAAAAGKLLADLVARLQEKSVYRGKALSFATTHAYHGGLGVLKVHEIPPINLDEVILPKATLDALDRSVFQFIRQRADLKKWGYSTKRGVLLYGPPGTGKTHFIKYCLSNLPEYTSFIVAAEQVAFMEDIMIMARALAPSLIVIEDADLIARSREEMNGPCEEVMLNKLLNEMDGLAEDADIIFMLTTNRPEMLEDAIRNRPGRIDQAIEIPRPDAECRRRLLALYQGRAVIPDDVAAECVKRTQGVTASFIKEMARRMAQYALLKADGGNLRITDREMQLAFADLFAAGTASATYLGGARPEAKDCD